MPKPAYSPPRTRRSSISSAGGSRGGFNLTLTNRLGTIHYTTNGADPRVRFSGAVALDAYPCRAGTSIVIDRTVLVRARSQWGTNWSAVTEAASRSMNSVPLRYHGDHVSPVRGEEYEFIELQNLSAVPIGP